MVGRNDPNTPKEREKLEQGFLLMLFGTVCCPLTPLKVKCRESQQEVDSKLLVDKTWEQVLPSKAFIRGELEVLIKNSHGCSYACILLVSRREDV